MCAVPNRIGGINVNARNGLICMSNNLDTFTMPANEGEAIAILERLAGFAEGAAPIVRTAGDGALPRTDAARKGWQPDLRYRSLVEKLPVVTFMASLDATQQELYISPQSESLLGFTQEECLEDPFLWFDQLHPDDRDRWVHEFARTCATGAHFR